MTVVEILALLKGDPQAERAIPKRGIAAHVTTLTAAALAFLAVFVLSVAMAAGGLARGWAAELTHVATVRVPADVAVDPVVTLLEAAPGVAGVRVLSEADQQALLAPWFGAEFPVDVLPLPALVEVTPAEGFDPVALQVQLTAVAPEVVVDDHDGWRRPLAAAAQRLRLLGWVAAGLLTLAFVGAVTLAAQVSLTANRQTISVLRTVGATDAYIAKGFVRRFTLRAFVGAVIGTLLGVLALQLLPTAGLINPVLFLFLPVFAGFVALLATRRAAFQLLQEVS